MGAGQVNSNPSKNNLLTITCSEDIGNDSFISENDIRFRIWDQSEQTEIDSSFVMTSFSNISNDQLLDNSTFQPLEDYQVLLRVSHSIVIKYFGYIVVTRIQPISQTNVGTNLLSTLRTKTGIKPFFGNKYNSEHNQCNHGSFCSCQHFHLTCTYAPSRVV